MGLGGRDYNSIDTAQAWRCRGTYQQTDNGLIYATPTYRAFSGAGSVGLGSATSVRLHTPGFVCGGFALHNRSAGPIVAGFGVRIQNSLWKFGQWTQASGAFTDDTTDAQSTATNDVALETAATANDGHIIACRVPFNCISYNIGTASTGSPVRAVSFSNQAGTGWNADLTPADLYVQDGSGGNLSTGEQLIVALEPVDWGKSVGLATNLSDGYYCMRIRTTTAATIAALASSLEVHRLYYLVGGLGQNASLEEPFSDREMNMGQDTVEGMYGDAAVALFSTAHSQNRVSAQLRC